MGIEGHSIPLPVIGLRKAMLREPIGDVYGTDSVVTVDEFDNA
jgi:hypothetical protein